MVQSSCIARYVCFAHTGIDVQAPANANDLQIYITEACPSTSAA